MAPQKPRYAVIFDFDGVLFESEPTHCEALRRLLVETGVSLTWPEYVDHFVGLSDQEICHRLVARYPALRELDTGAFLKRKWDVYAELIENGIAPIEGAAALVHRLRDAGIPIAICSGSRRAEIAALLEAAKLDKLFDVIVATEAVAQSKPSPEGYLLAHQKLRARGCGLAPQQCIVIEDAAAGIQAARAAGMPVIALRKPYGSAGNEKPDAWIESLCDVTNEMFERLARA